ncbi:MAG TPA: hypothetical protein VK662_11890, partial [Acidothermaceae bacterium]|nr:hypothetical protein [Acidothermaceae bacterium]
MSGKHGRGKPGRSSQPDSAPSETAVQGAGDTLQSVGAVTEAPAVPVTPKSTVVYLPPRSAPTPPSLPPIRSAPLPGFAALLTPAAMAALSPALIEQLGVAPEPVVEQVPEPVAPEPVIEQVAEPVVEQVPEPVI